MANEDPYRVGVIIGSGIGDLETSEAAEAKIQAGKPSKVNPFTVPMMIANMAAGNVAIDLGAKGKCTSVVTACASSTHSIGDAFRAIQYGMRTYVWREVQRAASVRWAWQVLPA